MSGVAHDLLDEVEQDLAEFQRDEAVVWRAGALALAVVGLLVGVIAAAGMLACLIRWWSRARPALGPMALPVAGGHSHNEGAGIGVRRAGPWVGGSSTAGGG